MALNLATLGYILAVFELHEDFEAAKTWILLVALFLTIASAVLGVWVAFAQLWDGDRRANRLKSPGNRFKNRSAARIRAILVGQATAWLLALVLAAFVNTVVFRAL